jgi:hypothetical protein
MPETHKLGFGYGAIVDHGDGTASYRKPATFSAAFRVRIADVTGFSVSAQGKVLERTLKILGRGTDLATVSVNHGVAEKIEAWFRAHPAFVGPVATGSYAKPEASVADELEKLARLRDSGILSDAEFSAQKARLLG